MNSEIINVLLIDDNPNSTLAIQNLFRELKDENFRLKNIENIENIDNVFNLLINNEFDLLLLGISIPSRNTINFIKKLHSQIPNLAIIVLTDFDDKDFALDIVKKGAQDYLPKDKLNSKILSRMIKYSIERKRIEQEYLRQLERQKEEIHFLEKLYSMPEAYSNKSFYDKEPIRIAMLEIFNELVQHYGDAIDIALERRSYKLDTNISEKLQFIGNQMGFLKATPRDIIELHTIAIKDKIRKVNYAKSKAYIEEGRLMILELMGYLAMYYRETLFRTTKSNDSNISHINIIKEN
ncbi:MAG: response regulator [Spirochaetota bacterium]|nr:response regulator [Spirochaetota bacterium]